MFHVAKARGLEVYSDVKALAIDETSYQRGHKYITVVFDTDKKKVICVTKGRDKKAFNAFLKDFKLHLGNNKKIQTITCDMSIPYASSIKSSMPNATRIIDKFHIFKYLSSMMNNVRRLESESQNGDTYENRRLKKYRKLLLRNSTQLTVKQIDRRNEILEKHSLCAIAYAFKVELENIFDNASLTTEQARIILTEYINRAKNVSLDPLTSFAFTLELHLQEIANYFDYRITNAIMESTNKMIQDCKSRAYGFKNLNFFKTIIYLVRGKLNFVKTLNANIKY